MKPGRTILEQAEKATAGRDEWYGHPAANLARIAGMWSALFGRQFTPDDVAVAMLAMKLSRLVQTPGHTDSLVDIAGYARTIERLRDT